MEIISDQISQIFITSGFAGNILSCRNDRFPNYGIWMLFLVKMIDIMSQDKLTSQRKRLPLTDSFW